LETIFFFFRLIMFSGSINNNKHIIKQYKIRAFLVFRKYVLNSIFRTEISSHCSSIVFSISNFFLLRSPVVINRWTGLHFFFAYCKMDQKHLFCQHCLIGNRNFTNTFNSNEAIKYWWYPDLCSMYSEWSIRNNFQVF